MGWDHGAEHHLRGAARRTPIGADTYSSASPSPPPREPQRAVAEFHIQLAASANSARLDVEQVRKVGLSTDRHGAGGRLPAQVEQYEVLPHARANEAVAFHEQRALSLAGPRAGPADERRVVGAVLDHRQRFDQVVIDPKLPGRQDPGVAEEQPLRRPGAHVPAVSQRQNDVPSTSVTVPPPSWAASHPYLRREPSHVPGWARPPRLVL
jgi:hypothetical protein